MAIGDEVSLRIEGIAAGGEGIARLEGKSVFVGGAAPGERLRCRITEEHRSWARAEVLEIIKASQDRVEPACPFYGNCGGCALQHLNYQAQLAAKAAILRDCFSRIGGFSPPDPATIPSAPWEYRNRVQFHHIQPCRAWQSGQTPHEGTQGQKCELGYMAHNSAALVPVSDCPVSDPAIRALLRKSAQGEAPLSPMPGNERFTVYARKGLFLYEGGMERGKTKILDREISLDASVFFQSNGALLEALAAKLRKIAATADRSRAMADLYCGVGTFACFLGGFFPKIDLLEENKKAIALAKGNIDAALPGNQTEFFALRDTDWVKLRPGGYGFIVADPPRQGLAPALASWLAEAGPPLLAYVSCDPASLARDSKVLRKGGYELAELSLFDFYPQTAHIESLAVFVR